MHPAFSVIFFTTVSGAGLGLFILLVLSHVFGMGGAMEANTVYAAGITSLVMITAGLISSTFHLANKINAWRAFFRWRTSWLAREGVFSIVFFPFAVAWLGGLWLNGGMGSSVINLLGLIAVLLAVTIIFSTGMIYACLKTIRQWNTSLTPANYLAFGLATGAILLTFFRDGNAFTATLALVLVVTAATTKTIYYFWIGRPKGATINTATGFSRARVRILDVGHTAGTFLTQEFGHQVAPANSAMLRTAVYLLAFLIPGVLMVLTAQGQGDGGYALAAIISALVGVAVERWLFFAEARHVVNLFHGAQGT